MKKGKILIVDDNKSVLDSLNLFLKQKCESTITLSNPNQIPILIKNESPDVVLLDMNFSAGINTGNEGIYWLNRILKIDPTIIVIMITAYSDVELAVKAMKEGATDFISKPWDNNKLLATIQTALKLRSSQQEVKKLETRQQTINSDIDRHFQLITGNSDKMKAVLDTVNKVSKTDANILITGENGTGKELIARQIYKQSTRNKEVFIPVDLGAIHENLFESEMFGHKKGAFTDAKEDRTGRFVNANGGTIFLDEIGNLPLNLQAKLLTVLESRTVMPIGSNKEIPIDIRLISATNKNIPKMVEERIFREDLLYRINTIHIEIPPLRERIEDIILLAAYFLNSYAQKYQKPKLKLNETAIKKLMTYEWPGNIRELKHTMERAVILSSSEIIKSEDFYFLSSEKPVNISNHKIISLDEGEELIIKNALIRNNYNISDTAKELKIGRPTLYRKIEKYGL